MKKRATPSAAWGQLTDQLSLLGRADLPGHVREELARLLSAESLARPDASAASPAPKAQSAA